MIERKRHWRHGITGAGYIDLNSNEMYSCPHCDKEYKTRNGLGQHIAYRHQGIKVDFYNNRIAWNKGMTRPLSEKSIEKILEGKANTKTNRRIIEKFLIERDGYHCSECGLSEWRDKEISLDIDHIDGDSENNFPENLRFLCPNCHRQTETWGNKRSK